MTSARRVTALAAALLLAGCGGGGGSAPATPHAAAPAPSPSGAPIATAKIAIKFPATFFHAKMGAKTAAVARSARKGPAYVNPGSSNVLNIWVNGNNVVSNTTIGSINNTQDDGSVNLSFPIYTTSLQQIAVVETDANLPGGDILALGETDLPAGTFNVGDTLQISVSLAMNAAFIGVMSDPNNGNGDAYIGPPNSFTFGGCTSSGTIYPFAADLTGGSTGFVTTSGLGTAIPSLGSWTNLPGTSPPATVSENNSIGQGLGYNIFFNDGNSSHGIQMSFNVLSPITNIANDLINSPPGTGLYPALELLLNSGAISIGAFNTLQFNPITATYQIFWGGGC
jgi:hypothetical protein